MQPQMDAAFAWLHLARMQQESPFQIWAISFQLVRSVISIFADLSLRASRRLAEPPGAASQLTSADLWPSCFLADRHVKMRVKMGTFVQLRED